MARKKGKAAKKPQQMYGIAEWYGERYSIMSAARRKQLADVKHTSMPCPFMHDVPALGPKNGSLNCNKAGGICSIRNFHPPQGSGDIGFGEITATCPNRFLQNGIIVTSIGRELLGVDEPLFAKEIPFLRRPRSPVAAEAVKETEEEEDAEAEDETAADREDVGRIDLAFADPDDTDEWCAVEMQAVYFSGGAMSHDLAAIRVYSGNGIPMPAKVRRPDFRSSGPKRLMPQLMIKVPALRRWGKKMVVVVDKPFMDAMDTMDRADHVSNSDIVWVVVRFDEDLEHARAQLNIHDVVLTTLEDAIIGLTAGRPTTKPEFEEKLRKSLRIVRPSTSEPLL